MTRLIDADTLRVKLDELGWTVENGFHARIHIDSIIENIPTISPYKAIHDELHKGEEE